MILLTRDTMQNPNQSGAEDKFAMNFSNYDTKSLFNATHMGGMNIGLKRSAHEAGFERDIGIPSDVDESLKKEDKSWASSSRDMSHHHLHQQQTHLGQPDSQCHPQQQQQPKSAVLPNGKKTKGRVKIKMEFIDNKLRRYTTFSKRKTGIMKKAYELSTLTGTQVMLLVASETGHVYTFATRKLQPMITSEAGKALIQTCLNSPDPPQIPPSHQQDQRMSATGYEETELSYAVNEEEHKSPGLPEDYMNGSSCSGSDSSSPPTPCLSPAHTPVSTLNSSSLSTSHSHAISSTVGAHAGGLPLHLGHGLVLTPSITGEAVYAISSSTDAVETVPITLKALPVVSDITEPGSVSDCSSLLQPTSADTEVGPYTMITSSTATTLTIKKPPTLSGGSVVVGNPGSSLMYAPGSGVVYASTHEGSTPLLLNLPPGLHLTQEQGSGSKPHVVTLPMSMASAAALQQSAAAAAAVSSTTAGASSSHVSCSHSSQSLPTDLSLHIKRETDS